MVAQRKTTFYAAVLAASTAIGFQFVPGIRFFPEGLLAISFYVMLFCISSLSQFPGLRHSLRDLMILIPWLMSAAIVCFVKSPTLGIALFSSAFYAAMRNQSVLEESTAYCGQGVHFLSCCLLEDLRFATDHEQRLVTKPLRRHHFFRHWRRVVVKLLVAGVVGVAARSMALHAPMMLSPAQSCGVWLCVDVARSALAMLFAVSMLVVLDVMYWFVLLPVDLEPRGSTNAPWSSASLQEFWAKRWNLSIGQLLRELVYDRMRRQGHGRWVAATGTFVVSGILHMFEFWSGGATPAASVAVGTFFFVQPLLLFVERFLRTRLPPSFLWLPRVVITTLLVMGALPLIGIPFAQQIGL